MKRLFTIIFASIVFLSCSQTSYHKISGFTQGTTYTIIFSDSNIDKKIVEEIPNLINSTLEDIDQSLSGYNKSSTLSKVNQNENPTLDSFFIDIFNKSMVLYSETRGYFDVSGAPLYDFWGFGFENPQILDEAMNEYKTKLSVDSILMFVGLDMASITTDQDGLARIQKQDPRIKLNFNAIAQGYSCDLIGNQLDELGVADYLIEIGGETFCKGLNANKEKWRIGIDSPKENSDAGVDIQEVLHITNQGVATSGNYRKFYEKNGEKYTHSINPISGYPVNQTLLSATIIAPDATTADAIATYAMVVGEARAIEYIESKVDIKYYFISSDEAGEYRILTNMKLD